MKTITNVYSALALTAGLALSGLAQADYPQKPVSFVVPFPPGDLEDVLTRLVAEDFSERYDVSAAVINKPGGGGGPFPGAIEVANAPADGYTIGSFVLDVPLVGPLIGIPDLNPNPFEPIGIFVTYPFVIAAAQDAPYNNMQELADYAQNNKVALAHFGAELTPTQVTFALAKKLGFEYSEDAPFDAIDCNTFSSGDADVGNTTLQLIQPCLDKVKVLVSLTPDRITHTPNSQAISEIAPELGLALWNGLFVHKDTPADVREKIATSAKATMASDRAQDIARKTGAFVYWQDASESQAQIEADLKAMEVVGALLAQ
jgi:tripartite-type tricarboxylate transporter receptor subunit TctC